MLTADLRSLYGIQVIDPTVVDLVRSERWNGTLPQTLFEGTGAVPLVSVPAAGPAK